MGYFLQKLAEAGERNAKDTITGGISGGVAGAALGAGGLGAAYGGRVLANKATKALARRAANSQYSSMEKALAAAGGRGSKGADALLDAVRRGDTSNKDAKKLIGLMEKKKNWQSRALANDKSLAKHLGKLKGAAKYAIPATALAGLVGGGYALGKD